MDQIYGLRIKKEWLILLPDNCGGYFRDIAREANLTSTVVQVRRINF